ncbi:hypothetical protein chiPu_0026204 [Chiloscyllium punctatum]|uniref:Uncharacterized protein n=1 Tax=Chiloscyllium punctatum TaxID=137246 RepID=A0A401THY6_CHIPU|nr:hypothetical protein [Chiloscyllium punctatum]
MPPSCSSSSRTARGQTVTWTWPRSSPKPRRRGSSAVPSGYDGVRGMGGRGGEVGGDGLRAGGVSEFPIPAGEHRGRRFPFRMLQVLQLLTCRRTLYAGEC